MKTTLRNTIVFLLPVFISLIMLNGCSKSAVEAVQQTAYQKQFEDNILNKNFRVQLAVDNGTDLTAQYNGYTYVLYKSTYYNGSMTAVKDGITYNGSWSSNEDYSKLSISFPSAPAEFAFLNRDWKFTKKSLPIMELAPWGTLEPLILHMERY
ncbi:MAG TPA: hypothetical protein VHL77_05060 [Ferruginibacter sp.]|jgi:hypothetical protein|nr:hypothetical protein [Ferruginibacter sp.]